jgi:hypothetical protein
VKTSPLIFRLLAYAAVCGIVFEVIVRVAAAGRGEWLISENGPVEIIQFLLALGATIMFALASGRSSGMRDLLALFALAALFATARELDRVLDHAFVEGGYKYVGVGLLSVGLVAAWRARTVLGRQLGTFARTPPAYLLFAACVTVLVYAQIVGQQRLWSALMGDAYIWQVKRAVEEVSELLGYLFLLCAAVETCLFQRGSTSRA